MTSYVISGIILTIIIVNCSSTDFQRAVLSRQKRLLVFEPGLNWVQMVAGAGIPVDLKGYSITFGPVVKSYFALPDNSSYYTHPSIDLQRKKRSTTSRWKLYDLLSNIITRYGIDDGKACILHAICEVASTKFDLNSGLFSEILHIFLTPSRTKEAIDNQHDQDYLAAEQLGKNYNCDHIYPECKTKFIHIFTNTYQIY